MEVIIEMLNITGKGEMMYTLGMFQIHKEINLDNQISDKCTMKSNEIFDTIIQINTNRGHTPL
jgi:hypothetical protein